MKNRVFPFLLGLLFTLLPKFSFANVRLNALFADHMVVQRETEIPVWGWADPSEEIIIRASWGATAKVVTGNDSTWMVKLITPEAGGPFQITFTGNNSILLSDVFVGEVWLCGGQSNMDHHLSTYTADAKEPKHQPLVEYIRSEIENSKDSLLRTIVVPHQTSICEKKKNFKASWQSVNPEQTGNFSATGYFFAKELREHLNVPIGIIECARGATRIQPWISEEAYMSDEKMKSYFLAEKDSVIEKLSIMNAPDYVDSTYIEQLRDWEEKGKVGNTPKPTTHPENDIQIPSTYHNGMVSVIIPYAIKGAIWYQGESNSKYMTDVYGEYFAKLITSWRSEWNQGDFSFYWTQLSAYRQSNQEPLAENGWASISDQQRRTLNVINTGMAVTHDIGEAKDIHPHNKMDVGKRLSLWALKNDYNFTDIVCSGPLYNDYQIIDKQIEITFTHCGSGLMVGKKELLIETIPQNKALKRFQIKGESEIWKWANAEIVSKNKIMVSHPEIPQPKVVRYAWSENPEGANLYNKEGLPASVFTTE